MRVEAEFSTLLQLTNVFSKTLTNVLWSSTGESKGSNFADMTENYEKNRISISSVLFCLLVFHMEMLRHVRSLNLP